MINISFSIPDESVIAFKNAFLRENPVPEESTLTEVEWIEEWGRLQYLRAVERGAIKLAQESVVVLTLILYHVLLSIKT